MSDYDKLTRDALQLAGYEMDEADTTLTEWAHEAGWATGHGDTLAEIVRELRAQWREERERLAALGGAMLRGGSDWMARATAAEGRLAALERLHERCRDCYGDMPPSVRRLLDALAAAPAKREGGE